MHFIKSLMLIVLWIATSFIGKLIAKKYCYRVYELEDMKSALNIFKSKIKFTYSPIKEVFEEISKNASQENIKRLFDVTSENIDTISASESWELALNSVDTNMKEEDIRKLKSLSKMLRNI